MKRTKFTPLWPLFVVPVGLALFFWALQPNKTSQASSFHAPVAQAGADVYQQYCQSCHQADGKGVKGTFPPLAGNQALKNTDFVIAVVLHGLDNVPIVVDGVQYQGTMPAWGDQLSHEEIAAVITHERTSWGNDFGEVTADQVTQVADAGQKPEDLLPDANRPQTSAQPTPTGGQSEYAGQLLGEDEIKKLLGQVHYDYPFPGEIYNQGGPFMEAVQLGYLIFTDTQTYAREYVGDDLNCRNCHLNAGALPYSAPMWAAYPVFPTYRSKNHRVNSFQARMQGCFVYSMNGTAPPEGGETLVALESYIFWLSQGVPVGMTMPGRGYGEYEDAKKISSDLTPNMDNGEQVFLNKCAVCHGENGQGMPAYQEDHLHIPPLWGTGSFGYWLGSEFGPQGPFMGPEGPVSFNWGAGMHNVSNFSAFAKYNMPLGQANTLTDQQAVDVAGWVLQDNHQRPIRWSEP